MIAVLSIALVLLVIAWSYDYRAHMRDKQELKRVATNLLDELKRVREKYGETSSLIGPVLFRNPPTEGHTKDD